MFVNYHGPGKVIKVRWSRPQGCQWWCHRNMLNLRKITCKFKVCWQTHRQILHYMPLIIWFGWGRGWVEICSLMCLWKQTSLMKGRITETGYLNIIAYTAAWFYGQVTAVSTHKHAQRTADVLVNYYACLQRIRA